MLIDVRRCCDSHDSHLQGFVERAGGTACVEVRLAREREHMDICYIYIYGTYIYKAYRLKNVWVLVLFDRCNLDCIHKIAGGCSPKVSIWLPLGSSNCGGILTAASKVPFRKGHLQHS